MQKDVYEILMVLPLTAALNAGGIGKIAFFDRSRSLRLKRLTAENLCLSATVVRVHNGALAEEYAVSSATGLDVGLEIKEVAGSTLGQGAAA